MTVRRTLYATAVSASLHAALAASIGWLCWRQNGGSRLDASLWALARTSVYAIEQVDVEVISEAAALGPAAPPAAPAPLRSGDGTRDVHPDGAPSPFPGRDPHPVAAAGVGPGAPLAPESTGRRDDQTLHTQLQNALSGYQAPRVRTSSHRASPEPRFQLPAPGGQTALSRLAGPAEGSRAGAPGDVAGPNGETAEDRPGDAETGAARPLVPAGPEATFAYDRDRVRPTDDTDSRLRSDDPRPHMLADIEMTRAAAPGAGEAGGGPAARPGFSAERSRGTAALPLGDPGAPRDEELWLRTSDRRYAGYFQEVYRKVKSNWVYPRALAIQLQQGIVVVSFTIRKDGRVEHIAVQKSSGFREFDENVIRAIERAAPLPPIPAALGSRDLRVNDTFEYLNPLVR